MLELRDLTVRYGAVTALAEVSLRVAPGEMLAVLGANGAGKSTLLRTISGLLRPAAGTVLLDGDNIAGLAAEAILRRGVAHVPEGRRIFRDMTVRENLLIGAYARRERTARLATYERVVAAFPVLGERASQQGATLSGGEQQMLAIGRALMSRPRLLLADEVSLGLAPVVMHRVFAELARLREAGITLVVVEQNAALALRHADHAVVLKHGRVVLAGPAAALAASGALADAYLGVQGGTDHARL